MVPNVSASHRLTRDEDQTGVLEIIDRLDPQARDERGSEAHAEPIATTDDEEQRKEAEVGDDRLRESSLPRPHGETALGERGLLKLIELAIVLGNRPHYEGVHALAAPRGIGILRRPHLAATTHHLDTPPSTFHLP